MNAGEEEVTSEPRLAEVSAVPMNCSEREQVKPASPTSARLPSWRGVTRQNRSRTANGATQTSEIATRISTSGSAGICSSAILLMTYISPQIAAALANAPIANQRRMPRAPRLNELATSQHIRLDVTVSVRRCPESGASVPVFAEPGAPKDVLRWRPEHAYNACCRRVNITGDPAPHR